MTYLDHNATSPLDPRVLERMLPWLGGQAGNPSSVHRLGQRTRAAVDDARELVAQLLGVQPRELVFTSGGTESDNLALRGAIGAGRRRIVTTAVEHPAVRETARHLRDRAGVALIEVPVDRDGALERTRFAEALGPDAVASVMWANNETGIVFPIAELAFETRSRGTWLHVDATQAAGRLPIDLATTPIDLLTLSGHKLGGPQGVGVLVVRTHVSLAPLGTGGHQERGRRPGTENVAGIVGFAEALRLATERLDAYRHHIGALRDRLERGIRTRLPEAIFLGEHSPRIVNTSNVLLPDVDSETVLMGLDLRGIHASAGSACSSGSLEPSPVHLAMGIDPGLARGAIRFSLGPGNTEDDVDRTVEALVELTKSCAATP